MLRVLRVPCSTIWLFKQPRLHHCCRLFCDSSKKPSGSKTPEEYEVVVIGGGSSGLSMSFFLSCLRRTHIVFEKGDSVGTFWKENLWDSFKLISPGWSIQLPAMNIKQEQTESFFEAKEVLEHLEEYQKRMRVPLRLKEHVTNIKYDSLVDSRDSSKKYLIETSKGNSYLARDVVICTGSYQTPKLPPLFNQLPPHIQRLHSSKYRNPQSVGNVVLVVGSGQSGLEIVNELVEAGKSVFLSLGHTPATFPRRYRGYDNMDWMARMGFFAQDVKSMSDDPERPSPEQLRTQSSSSTFITDQPWFLSGLIRRGVVMLGRLRDRSLMNGIYAQVLEFEPVGKAVEDSELPNQHFRDSVDAFILEEKLMGIPRDPPYPPQPQLPPHQEILSVDVNVAQIDTVIFATGYEKLRFPMLTEMVKEKERAEQYLPGEHELMYYGDGYPRTANGQSFAFPGLYFLGLRWLISAASATLFGAPYDASVVAMKIARMRGYPHQNMIAPQFLDRRIADEDNWDKVDDSDQPRPDEEDDNELSSSEEQKYFPHANPDSASSEGMTEAEVLEAVRPPKRSPLDPNNLPTYILPLKKPKKQRRNMTYAEIQREQKNQEILAKAPKTAEELRALIEKEEAEANLAFDEEANAADEEAKDPFSQFQPKVSRKKSKAKKNIDPYADFASEETQLLEAGSRKSFISSAHPKHKKSSPGQLFSLANLDFDKLAEDAEEEPRVRYLKQPKKGVRGTIERYLQGHRGLKDIRKQKTPRK